MFLKHIGKHGDRKVCVLFRKVPNEDHMCLVLYPEVLPSVWHDAIMKVLESDVGQQAKEFADALHRSLLPDGRPILETLHQERMIKKIKTEEVAITPRPGSHVRLNELNRIIDEMETGQQAIDRMQELDNQRGMVSPEVKRRAESEFKESRKPNVKPITAPANGALDDRQLASDMLAQATRMEVEAKSLIAEAARMKKDAERMHPGVVASTTSPVSTTNSVAKKPRATKKTAVGENVSQ